MPGILDRIDKRLRLLKEEADLSWKSFEAMRRDGKSRDPGPSYHALMATAGPCTTHPVWARDWQTPDGYTFREGTPAPQWTHEEVHQAMAAQIRIWANLEGRRSFGKRHGSRIDPGWIDEMIGNMHAELQRILIREKDQGRILGGDRKNGFVSFVTATVRQAAAKGLGSTTELDSAMGRTDDLLKAKRPEQAREIADRVGEEYRTERSHRIDSANPYGIYSPVVYRLGHQLADALESGDVAAVNQIKTEIKRINAEIRDDRVVVYGTDTGKRTIQTPHGAKEGGEARKDLEKFYRTGIASISSPRTTDGDESAMDLPDQGNLRYLGDLDPETIYQVLSMARNTPQSQLSHPSLAGKGLEQLNDFDLRYLIRLLSNWLPQGKYPGKGTPGKDPELIQGPDGRPHPSEWARAGQPQMWDKDEILADIGQNAGGEGGGLEELVAQLTPVEKEIMKLLGTGTPKAEISRIRGISKVAVGATVKRALAKLRMNELEFKDYAASGGAATGGGPDPLTKFGAWMRQYKAEQEVEEGRDSIEYEIVWRTARAITELHYHHVIRPMLED